VSAFADEIQATPAIARIYSVECARVSQNLALKRGYGLVLADVQVDGNRSQIISFTAKLKELKPLCTEQNSNLRYITKKVMIYYSDSPFLGGTLSSFMDPDKSI